MYHITGHFERVLFLNLLKSVTSTKWILVFGAISAWHYVATARYSKLLDQVHSDCFSSSQLDRVSNKDFNFCAQKPTFSDPFTCEFSIHVVKENSFDCRIQLKIHSQSSHSINNVNAIEAFNNLQSIYVYHFATRY